MIPQDLTLKSKSKPDNFFWFDDSDEKNIYINPKKLLVSPILSTQ